MAVMLADKKVLLLVAVWVAWKADLLAALWVALLVVSLVVELVEPLVAAKVEKLAGSLGGG